VDFPFSLSKPRIPQPGDLIKVDFDTQAGHEQDGWRPALIVSEVVYNWPGRPESLRCGPAFWEE
jgi:hypothetical protein